MSDKWIECLGRSPEESKLIRLSDIAEFKIEYFEKRFGERDVYYLEAKMKSDGYGNDEMILKGTRTEVLNEYEKLKKYLEINT